MDGLSQYPLTSNYQNDPIKVERALKFLEQKSKEAKKTIEELLYLLDANQNARYPEMLDKFSALAAAMVQIETALKKSAVLSGQEDFGQLLRCHVLVPQRLQIEPDPQLQELTQNRLASWNHDVVPEYLRTKMNLDLEQEEMVLENEKNQKSGSRMTVTGPDLITKQTTSLNKNVEALSAPSNVIDREFSTASDKPTHSREETLKLVRAVMCGEGVRAMPNRPPQGSDQMQRAQQGQQVPKIQSHQAQMLSRNA